VSLQNVLQVNSINCATDASITCSFESNFLCGYNRVSGGSQLNRWSAVAGPAGINEGPTVGTTTGQLTGLTSCCCALYTVSTKTKTVSGVVIDISVLS